MHCIHKTKIKAENVCDFSEIHAVQCMCILAIPKTLGDIAIGGY